VRASISGKLKGGAENKSWTRWLVYLWAGLIFALSSVPNLNPPRLEIVGIDKLAHFVEYLILACFAFGNTRRTRSKYILPLILLFAVADELHQQFIPGREVELADLGINFVGILLGWLWKEERNGNIRKKAR
jgi:VanZ family protein